jgi:hypothetical protein
MNLHEVTMKYGMSVVFICHDSVEIWGFRYGLKLCIGNQKVMARTGIFVVVVFSLKDSTYGHGRQKNMI